MILTYVMKKIMYHYFPKPNFKIYKFQQVKVTYEDGTYKKLKAIEEIPVYKCQICKTLLELRDRQEICDCRTVNPNPPTFYSGETEVIGTSIKKSTYSYCCTLTSVHPSKKSTYSYCCTLTVSIDGVPMTSATMWQSSPFYPIIQRLTKGDVITVELFLEGDGSYEQIGLDNINLNV